MKVYIDDVEVTEAFNIKVNQIMNAIDSATFNIPNVRTINDSTAYDAWVDKIQTSSVRIEKDPYILFRGYISSVSGNDVLTINCKSDLNRLTWKNLPSEATDFVVFQGKVAGVSGTTITVEDEDENSPDWSADDLIDDYVVVSDSTKGETEVQLARDSLSYLGYDSIYSTPHEADNGNYTDVENSDTPSGDDYWIKWESNSLGTGSLNQTGKKYIGIGLGLENYSIAKTSTINKIEVEMFYSVKTEPFINYHSDFSLYTYLSKNNDLSYPFEVINTYTKSFPASTDEKVVYVNTTYSLGESNQENVFVKGASYWEGGYIGVGFYAPEFLTEHDTCYILVALKTLKVKVYYDTGTFDVINVKITDNTSNTLTTSTNFTNEGVSVGDSVMVGKPMSEAFDNVLIGAVSKSPYIIYDSVDLGIAQQWTGPTQYQLFKSLCDLNAFDYYCWYDSATALYARAEDNFYTYSTPLSDFKTPKNLEVQDNKYGYIEIWWSGQTDGDNPVRIATGNGLESTYSEIHKEILTYGEAYNLATKLADKYADYHKNVELEWDDFQILRLAWKCNFNVYGISYTDIILRRLEYTYNNGIYKTKAYFGGGHTPPYEKLGMTIGDITKRLNNNDNLALTRAYNPSLSTVQWNNILGRPSTFTPSSHHASHEEGGSDEIDINNLAGTLDPSKIEMDSVNSDYDTLQEWFQAVQ
ncbi:MAG: hypothetical protein DRN30_06860, partial [Thermoplasmata archaeon]